MHLGLEASEGSLILHVWSLGCQHPKAGGGCWAPGSIGQEGERRRETEWETYSLLQPSLRSHTASFWTHSAHKPTQVQGEGKRTSLLGGSVKVLEENAGLEILLRPFLDKSPSGRTLQGPGGTSQSPRAEARPLWVMLIPYTPSNSRGTALLSHLLLCCWKGRSGSFQS